MGLCFGIVGALLFIGGTIGMNAKESQAKVISGIVLAVGAVILVATGAASADDISCSFVNPAANPQCS